MPIFSRYRSTPKLALGYQYGTTRAVVAVRMAVQDGLIPIVETITLSEKQRLDHLAAIYYDDSRFWWVLAAASDIGWGLQVPAGTIINIPDINSVATIIG
jgi:hypothetical protein